MIYKECLDFKNITIILQIILLILINYTGCSKEGKNTITTRKDNTPKISRSIFDARLIDSSGEVINVESLLKNSKSRYQWIYFFLPGCPACNVIAEHLDFFRPENLIGISLTEHLKIEKYKNSNRLIIPIFSYLHSQGKLKKISIVPCLIKIDEKGKILSQEENYKLIIAWIEKNRT